MLPSCSVVACNGLLRVCVLLFTLCAQVSTLQEEQKEVHKLQSANRTAAAVATVTMCAITTAHLYSYAADTHPAGTASAPSAPSGATSTAADLEGLFTTASPASQAAPQLWPPTSPAQGRGGLGSPQAGIGMQGGFPQPGMGMQPGMGIQPGASMGYMPGGLSFCFRLASVIWVLYLAWGPRRGMHARQIGIRTQILCTTHANPDYSAP